MKSIKKSLLWVFSDFNEDLIFTIPVMMLSCVLYKLAQPNRITVWVVTCWVVIVIFSWLSLSLTERESRKKDLALMLLFNLLAWSVVYYAWKLAEMLF